MDLPRDVPVEANVDDAFAGNLLLATLSADQRALFVEKFQPMPPNHLITDRVRNNVENARDELRSILNGPTCEGVNDSAYGLAASVWSENLNLALDVAARMKAGVVWVNSTNLFDAAAGFGGYKESGFGREGGREGLYEYLVPAWEKALPEAAEAAPAAFFHWGLFWP